MNNKFYKINQVFEECQIERGDIVFLHSDAFFLSEFEGNSLYEKAENFFIQAEKYLGENGSLILPTFSYSFTKGEFFDVMNTQSDVGILSECFRIRNNVNRSRDPIFSVAASGILYKDIEKIKSNDCFGKGSIFDILYTENAKIVCIGCSFDRITFVHYVEQSIGVSYRYFKLFSGYIIDNFNNRYFSYVNYYVRKIEINLKTNLKVLHKELDSCGLIKRSSIGRASVTVVKSKDFYRIAEKLILSNPLALVDCSEFN
jgi:aminoglycoside 3-N-acetyltransferase